MGVFNYMYFTYDCALGRSLVAYGWVIGLTRVALIISILPMIVNMGV